MLSLRYFTFASLLSLSLASYYEKSEIDWNLNANKHTTNPLEYFVPPWNNHVYHPSPRNWRFPFYSFFLDRFVNGDPRNDNINGTAWEHDPYGTQLRHGGDIKGLLNSLDYLHGLGIRGIYVAGSILMNFPWQSDSYSPLDHTLIDHHFGTVTEFREVIQAIHDKGMYIILDNTMSTMSNLFGFTGYFNTSAPWSFTEHHMVYQSDRVYRDFSYSNVFEDECSYSYPRFWNQAGHLYDNNSTRAMVGCMDSEFDQYGDAEAFGIYPEWQKQLSKFNGVQDRLREWRPQVLDKINHFSCMLIQGLDIDGFRMDKAMQITVDPLGNFSNFQRDCAAKVGKENFFIVGEIVNGNTDGAIYLGRGKEPHMAVHNFTLAVTSNDSEYIREQGHQALDGACFHYSTYRAMLRFLGIDGDLLAAFDAPINFQDQWRVFVQTNDLNNAITGEFDPRHMYGVSNQDVFRWPGMTNGTERQLLGDFIVTLTMPGIPLVSWGEEQAFYTLDNTASNYIYGRQSMSSSLAWQMHGCYKVGDTNIVDAPFNSSLTSCQDDMVSLDHRDPSHPVHGVLKQMFELRRRYPVLNDGWTLQELSSDTFNYTLPGSRGVPTNTGLWSVLRGRMEGVQDLSDEGLYGNQGVWLLYSNYNGSRTYTSDCVGSKPLLSPFDTGTTVKNLFYPFDEWKLEESKAYLGIEGSTNPNGCLSKLNMTKYGWKAFVPIDKWTSPSPILTKFLPGHDARIVSNTGAGQKDTLDIEMRFSALMDCDSFRNSFSVRSTTESGEQAHLDEKTLKCDSIHPISEAYYYGPSPSIWIARATLNNVYDGVHVITLENITTEDQAASTGSKDHFLVRIGQSDNPIVFPRTANYSNSLLFQKHDIKREATITDTGLYINQKAAGADMWRFSLSFGAVWSDWMPYIPGNVSLPAQKWTGLKDQTWKGQHVQVQYWSSATGSSDGAIQGDLVDSSAPTRPERRFPHFFVHGEFNEYGFDSGIPNVMRQMNNGTWAYDFVTEWPSNFQLNVWGMDADGLPDVSYAFGDVDNDTVVDRIAPTSLQQAVVNVTQFPHSPHLAWRILFNDGDYRYYLIPIGSCWRQLAISILLAVIPVLSGISGVLLYVRAFYGVKFNEIGLSEKPKTLPIIVLFFDTIRKSFRHDKLDEKSDEPRELVASDPSTPQPIANPLGMQAAGAIVERGRRTILIATMEYDIADWNIKVKIGGLGVMAQLMGKELQHQDLVWVVPCAGDIDYPMDTPGRPIVVTVLGRKFQVQTQYHRLNNITYMLLDAPVFRKQTQKEPYPERMDDLDSAIYYSAWNQCIAEAIRRFPIDLYHINDYHGTVAPLYLLPEITVPCCLSLHNAEFQGLWPMRTGRETSHICSVFNLPISVVQQYVQFGEVFNLLHAGASILRIHQKGFGAVGVSKKYGKRSWARYPIFWGLRRIGALPNPDPSDVAVWDKKLADPNEIAIDVEFEVSRMGLKRQAQEWAGLEQRSDADLFVFVGRWSMQKGIDLIADVFPNILEQYEHTQLICVGPTIDLYGRFAALKLDEMVRKYPGRVYSKPEFTALPPFIFSGAEFALIPSRDEPFGLVAVEFGRKGALGVGSRVGGLGQMPGWWYTIESTTTRHHMSQFKMAISSALDSNYETRAAMRAWSAKQRFPVAQWKEDLEILQSTSIRMHKKHTRDDTTRRPNAGMDFPYFGESMDPNLSVTMETPMAQEGSLTPSIHNTPQESRASTRESSPVPPTHDVYRTRLSLGRRKGPSHQHFVDPEERPSLHGSNPGSSEEDDGASTHSISVLEEELITPQNAEIAKRKSQMHGFGHGVLGSELSGAVAHIESAPADIEMSLNNAAFLDNSNSPAVDTYAFDGLEPLAMEFITDDKNNEPQDLTPFFTDPTGLYYKAFEKKLAALSGKTSENQLCIEEYLETAEKEWFDRLHAAKMATTTHSTAVTPAGSLYDGVDTEEPTSQFLLPNNYSAPTGLRRVMMYKIGDWPLYSFLLALGQVLAASSYQITLLTGQIGERATQLYVVACIYLATTFIWWYVFRQFAAKWCLSLPWLFYGLAFFLLAIAPYVRSLAARGWVQNTAIAMYAVASSSGSLFFAQNFGSMGSAPVRQWALRACGIQGTQQLYVVGLWAFGAKLATVSSAGNNTSLGTGTTAIGLPIALFLWSIGIVLFLGLPSYYRQQPGRTPDFYASIFRRKIIIWFMVAVFLQNLFLSSQYGRAWTYLWSSKHAPGWAIFLLVVLFLVVLWSLVLWIFSKLSATHSWILPLFAVALLCPRWCQELWACSGMGAYLPWAGSPVASALLGRSLFLWLALLDSVQSVGVGMLLLQTLVRFHISFALMMAQVIGSIATIIARADGLNSVGPGPVFPDLAVSLTGLQSPWFWIAMLSQVVIAVGYYTFFRKEQLTKP